LRTRENGKIRQNPALACPYFRTKKVADRGGQSGRTLLPKTSVGEQHSCDRLAFSPVDRLKESMAPFATSFLPEMLRVQTPKVN
jgi:hypothetical protein